MGHPVVTALLKWHCIMCNWWATLGNGGEHPLPRLYKNSLLGHIATNAF